MIDKLKKDEIAGLVKASRVAGATVSPFWDEVDKELTRLEKKASKPKLPVEPRLTTYRR